MRLLRLQQPPPGAGTPPLGPGRPTPRAWAFERGRLWAINLDGEALSRAESEPRLPAVLDQVAREDAARLARAMGLPDSGPVLRRFASGRRCFAARAGDQIAAYCWVSQAPECIGELEHEIRVPPDEAYIWDCATLPAFRQKGLYSALLRHILVTLQGEGLRRVWIGSALDNRASQRAFARAGFRPAITIVYLRVLQLSFMRLTGDPTASGQHVAAARRMLTQEGERAWKIIHWSCELLQ